MNVAIANNVANSVANGSGAISYYDLGLSPVALDLGFFELRWYSLGYLAGIFIGYWYLLKLIKQPGAPLPAATPTTSSSTPRSGSSSADGSATSCSTIWAIISKIRSTSQTVGWRHELHGGVIGTTLGILYFPARKGSTGFGARLRGLHRADRDRAGARCQLRQRRIVGARPVSRGQYASRIYRWQPPARPAAIRLIVRALLEGAVLFAILAFMFWKTKARYEPGKLVGAFILFYGLFRFVIEFIREPIATDRVCAGDGLAHGQWLSVPMILGGLYLMLTAKNRRERVGRSPDGERGLSFADKLKLLIRTRGPLTVETYMAACNAHYYASRDPLGWQATSPPRRDSPDVRRTGRVHALPIAAARRLAGGRDLRRA